MKNTGNRERFKFFCLGLGVALALMMLAGATEIGPPSYGRYQLSSWGSSFGDKAGGFGVFVADTATGETKMVYTRIFGTPGEGDIKKNELEKTFFSINK